MSGTSWQTYRNIWGSLRSARWSGRAWHLAPPGECGASHRGRSHRPCQPSNGTLAAAPPEDWWSRTPGGRCCCTHLTEESSHRAASRWPLRCCPVLVLAVETKVLKDKTSTRTCNGSSIPAVRWRRVKLAGVALAHILLFVIVPLVGFRVRVRVQVKGRGGQLGSTLTS